jgi:hypothetical protein
MELNGEDKRIQALFCELKREQECTAPQFAKTWNVAEAEFNRSGVSRLRFQSPASLPRFAMAILVVSLVVAATVLLPKYLRVPRQPRQPTPDYAKQAATAGPRATSEEPPHSGGVPVKRESTQPTDRLLVIRRPVRLKRSQVAFAQQARSLKPNRLSQWQSPTATLLHSASDELLKLVPPMNESAEEMKKFLNE